MPTLSPLQIQKFTTLFAQYDRNQNQYLTLGDFHAYAESVARIFGWHEKTPHLVESRLFALKQLEYQIFAQLAQVSDGNHDGKVSLAEYLTYLQRQAQECKNMGTASPWIKQTIRQLIQIIDEDGSKTISLDEYSKMLQAMHSKADAAAAFAKMDKDGDGRLTIADLEQLALEFMVSDDPDAAGNLLFCGQI